MSVEKSKSWSIIIEKIDNETNEILEENTLINFCNRVFIDYYGICHDKDTNDSGELKRPHYHLIGIFDKTFGKARLLKLISVFLQVRKERITLTPTLSASYELRYLIHLDNPEKYQYSLDKVFALDKERYEYIIFRKMYLNFDSILSIAKRSKTYLQYLREIGIEFYEKHYRICDNIWAQRFVDNKPEIDT